MIVNVIIFGYLLLSLIGIVLYISPIEGSRLEYEVNTVDFAVAMLTLVFALAAILSK